MNVLSRTWSLDASRIDDSLAWIDIETIKVASPKNWPFKNRWQPIMFGILRTLDRHTLLLNVVLNENENEFCLEVADRLLNIDEVRYTATRRFDEMVLRGRFYHARAPLNVSPGPWPNLDSLPIEWTQLRPRSARLPRLVKDDVMSKDIARGFAKLDVNSVVAHCARDTIEVLLDDPAMHLSSKLRNALELTFRREFV